MRVLRIRPERSNEYSVIIGSDILRNIVELVNEVRPPECSKLVLCVQSSVKDHAMTRLVLDLLRGSNVEFHVIEFPSGEDAKSINTVLDVINTFYRIEVTKSDVVIGIGGGSLSDSLGFISSIYMRGLPLILIPTTLLSMVDSAIGGKNAVNVFGVKNMIGTIYQPRLVLCELSYLKTLPARELSSGIAEVIKYGVTMDAELLRFLIERSDEILSLNASALEEVVYRSIRCKGAVIEVDEYEEREVRQMLNFGHTVGHAVEGCCLGRITHGEAVMIGMIFESIIGHLMDITSPDVIDVLCRLADTYNLPNMPPECADLNSVIAKIRYDKKRRGDVMVVPFVTDVGRHVVRRVPLDDYIRYLVKAFEYKLSC